MVSGTVTLLSTFFFRECYAPALVSRKTDMLKKELGREDLKSKLALKETGTELLKLSLIRPTKLLTRSPIAFLTASYIAIIYGMLYLLLTTINTVFINTYGWSVEISGLVFMAFAIGMAGAMLTLMATQDKMVARLRARNNGVFEPEMRLKNLTYFCSTVGPSLLLYGWSVEYKIHWIVPVIALVLYGFGQAAIFIGTQIYVVDSFSQYAASAVAAVSFLRSLVGAFLVGRYAVCVALLLLIIKTASCWTTAVQSTWLWLGKHGACIYCDSINANDSTIPEVSTAL